jgi:aminotransferase in exopolysaccharide biosynthesis
MHHSIANIIIEETAMKEIPLSVPNLSMEIADNLRDCIETGWVSTGGKYISLFEEKVAKYMGIDEAVACQSGTAALHTSLRILGVEANDEVIVPTLTFIAAVNPVKYLGAQPIFMDCDDSLCIDINKLRAFCEKECQLKEGVLINRTTGRQVKAIIPVHIFGNLCNMEAIMSIASEFNLKVLEDATEALGSYYKSGPYQGRYAGTIGDMGALSFNANKIITTGGGGMILSNNTEYQNKARYLTTTAKDDNLFFVHDEVGYNYRMLNVQAALGVSQIDQLEDFIETKTKNYILYRSFLEGVAGVEVLAFKEGIRANHWFYSLLIDNEFFMEEKGMTNARNRIMEALIEEGIQVRPIWKLVHTQKPYQENFGYGITKAPYYESHVLNIPCSSNLTAEDVEIVSNKIIGIIK